MKDDAYNPYHPPHLPKPPPRVVGHWRHSRDPKTGEEKKVWVKGHGRYVATPVRKKGQR